MSARSSDDLALAAQRGDEGAMDELLARFEGYAQKAANKWTRGHALERDDVLIEARLGIVRAVREYDPTRGSVSTVAYLIAHQYAQRLYDASKRRKQAILNDAESLDAPIFEDGTSGHDLVADPTAVDVGADPDVEKRLDTLALVLAPAQRRLLRDMRAYPDDEAPERAARLGVSPEAVHSSLSRMRARAERLGEPRT